MPPSFYERRILPHLVQGVCGSPLIGRQRARLVPQARGQVLELGFGSGLNLAHYDPAQVTGLWALEPSAAMRALAAPRLAALPLPVHLLEQPAEALDLPSASIDTVVVTYSLCTIPAAGEALRQARRVLRPGGQLLFCEHGAAPDPAVRRWQDRLDRVWGRLAGGCHLNRDIPALVAAAGLRIDWLDSGYLPGTPRIAGFHHCGRALRD